MPSHPRHWPQYLGAFAVIIVMAGVASASAALLQVADPVQRFNEISEGVSDATERALDEVEPGKPQTLLLIGSDKRNKKAADGNRSGELSDTLILARLDPDQGATALLSIPRDTKAEIPTKGGGWRTAKVNEAFYEQGELGAIRAVRKLLDMPVHHVVVVNFSAFQRAINKLGCLYQDIDRTYFNDNSHGGERYATIDVKSGYQLLCGADTLDWVRFRHADSDFVRAARQQEFLRSSKSQIAASKIFDDRDELLEIFGRYSRTDIESTAAVLGLLKLAVNAAEQPVRTVKFRPTVSDDPNDTFITIADKDLAIMQREFTQLKAASGPTTTDNPAVTERRKATKKQSKSSKKKGLAAGLQRVPGEITKPELTKASFELAGRGLPVYFPAVRLSRGGYTEVDGVRAYDIQKSRYSKVRFPAFRLSFFAGEVGQYWGIQGTTWKDAPILKERSSTVKRNGRTLKVYPAGGNYRMVSWSTPNGVYWVSNTVSQTLTKQQMLDIAANLKRVPG